MEYFWPLKWCVLLIFISTPTSFGDHIKDDSCDNNLMLEKSASAVPTNSCNTLNSLAQALYETKDNILNLIRVFYPPNKPRVSFLRIEYETGDLDGCSVTYIWAKGGFLVVQPPKIFQMTSLLFNHIGRNFDILKLRLPYDCRHPEVYTCIPVP